MASTDFDYEEDYEDDFENYDSEQDVSEIYESDIGGDSRLNQDGMEGKQDGTGLDLLKENSEYNSNFDSKVSYKSELLENGVNDRSNSLDDSQVKDDDANTDLSNVPVPTLNTDLTHDHSKMKTSSPFFTFNQAKQKAKFEKVKQKIKSRGEVIQEMIQLDSVYFERYQDISESYESYMNTFGRTNYTQASVQTNDDALTGSTQTESIPTLDKWTQKPIEISSNPDHYSFAQDFKGVGGDRNAEESHINYHSYGIFSSNLNSFTNFFDKSVQVMLNLLEEDIYLTDENEASQSATVKNDFFHSSVQIGRGIRSLLGGRRCLFLAVCSFDSSLLLTGHGFANGEESSENSGDVDIGDQSLVCLWSMDQPSFPQKILTCRASTTCATLSAQRPLVVVVGLTDGSLACWDLRESPSYHPYSFNIEDSKWRLIPPSFVTSSCSETNGDGSPVVALETLAPSNDASQSASFQVVSLSASGLLTWWILIQEEFYSNKTNDFQIPKSNLETGAAPWSRILLARTASTFVQVCSDDESSVASEVCVDMKLSGLDSSQLYVAAANGAVLNISRHDTQLYPSSFAPNSDPGTELASISVSPHNPLYFLVGGFDGEIRLHSSSAISPITSWNTSAADPSPVKRLQWSPSRPCVFYVLDVSGSFYIWDLTETDIYPVTSLDSDSLSLRKLEHFVIPEAVQEDVPVRFMVFADETNVAVTKISDKYLSKCEKSYKKELELFNNYVDII